jgi:hypothetical protein
MVPSILLLAAVLGCEGVSFVLVGSAALWLSGETISVRDIDVVPRPGERNLGKLHAALAVLAMRRDLVPPLRSLPALDMVSVPTIYGKLDCLLERGRQDWDLLCEDARLIRIADAGVLVASAAHAWALRRAFKD